MKIETQCIHEGYSPKNTEPRVVPIVQSTTYVYDSTDDVAAVFDGDQTFRILGGDAEQPGQPCPQHCARPAGNDCGRHADDVAGADRGRQRCRQRREWTDIPLGFIRRDR